MVSTDGDRVTLHSSVALPPGTPGVGRDPEGQEFRVKVRGCRRIDGEPATYEVQARWVNLSRAQREQVLGNQQ